MITGRCMGCGKIKYLTTPSFKCVKCAVRLVAQPEPAEIIEEAGVKRIKNITKNIRRETYE